MLAIPGTYPEFLGLGVLSGTAFSLDTAGTVGFQYSTFVAATPPPVPSPTPTASPTPNPSPTAMDVWTGTVTYTGTPHDATVCFSIGADVSRAPFFNGSPDNAEMVSLVDFPGGSDIVRVSSVQFTTTNFVLTINGATGSGSFDVVGGGHAVITITGHLVLTDDRNRKLKAQRLRLGGRNR